MPRGILSPSFVVCFLAPLHLIEIYKTCLFGAFFLPCFSALAYVERSGLLFDVCLSSVGSKGFIVDLPMYF